MQPQTTKNVFQFIIEVVLFGLIGAIVGSITTGVVEFFQPGLKTYWDWLGPLIGCFAGFGLAFLVEFIRKHPEGVH